jgi:hypothetical protein
MRSAESLGTVAVFVGSFSLMRIPSASRTASSQGRSFGLRPPRSTLFQSFLSVLASSIHVRVR